MRPKQRQKLPMPEREHDARRLGGAGEQRLSNFLLWQSAYAELVFLDVLWPDFGPAHFGEALAEFNRRERRFGARPG